MRLKFIVAYDGSRFRGWQSQKHGGSVQDVIEAAFAVIAGKPVRIHGAGRTDAGVHATGQSFHVDPPPSRLEAKDWMRALNGNLPPSVRLTQVRKAPPGFHARFSATGKIYRYRIFTGAVLSPLDFGRYWHSPGQLSVDSLRRAASIFVGRHDFAPFSANRGSPAGDTTRTIRAITVGVRGHRAELSFEGDGFLYKMVRMLASACVRCCRGDATEYQLKEVLRRGAPRWTHVAPAGGLTLEKVLYARESALAAPDLAHQDKLQSEQ